jgi:hypothetical protein
MSLEPSLVGMNRMVAISEISNVCCVVPPPEANSSFRLSMNLEIMIETILE